MSFVKTFKSALYSIPGSKSSIQSTQLLLTSSGTPSLDQLLGGGLPCGSLVVLGEDVYGEYSKVLLKFFLAEGFACNHSILVASLDSDVKNLVSELPEPIFPDNETRDKSAGDSNLPLRIAWRYENVERIDAALNPSSNFGHYFDLSKCSSPETISKSKVDYWMYLKSDTEGPKTADFENPVFQHLLRTISMRLREDTFSPNAHSDKSNILRIGIESIGSPYWTTHEVGNPGAKGGKDLIKFLYCLRALLRTTYGVAFVTIPSHLYKNCDTDVLKRIMYAADFVLELESFAGSHQETNPLFKDYHGLVHVKKIAAMNILTPHIPAALDLAFKLRRKKFIIEKLHLPPELQDSAEREQDDLSNVSCSGSKKKNLDF